ncbi:PAS domain S-box protein [candidate division GN15 bacterium]|nr:PAS domain S-box protein [candidate division GN15 bacterium]
MVTELSNSMSPTSCPLSKPPALNLLGQPADNDYRAMAKHKHRYESEVRLGLVATVLVLVFLNFVSLFIIHRARSTKQDEASLSFQSAAVTISRAVQTSFPASPAESELADLKTQYGLSGLYLLPSRPEHQSSSARREWFAQAARSIAPAHLPDLASKLIQADFNQVTRGEDDEYYYLYPVPSGAGHSLLVISRELPELAWLDDAGETIFIVGLAAIGLVIITMLFLYRAIVAPFLAMRAEAAHAGRITDSESADAEAVVGEYKRIIRELEENERELRRLNDEISRRADSLEQFNTYLLRAVDSGIVTLALDGRVQTVNEAAARLLELDPREAAGYAYDNVFAANPELVLAVQSALAGMPTVGYREYEYPTSSGPEQLLGVTISSIRDSDEQRLGLSILINDITELNQLRRDLEEGQRLASLGAMAGGLAHQLRNAMGVIAGYGNLVRKRLEQAGADTETIVALMQETAEAEALVSQFLTFARPVEATPSPVSLFDVIEEVLGTFRVRDDCAGIDLQFDPAGTDLTVSIDALLFKQALLNIVDNATGAYPDRRGTVRVSCRRTGEAVEIGIRDHGVGMEPEQREQVFTPFYSTRPSGTGLGLPLARKMVELHGGRILVESVSGKGTGVTISLPLSVCASDRTPLPDSAQPTA